MTDVRHWKRSEPDGTTMYYATATNAGHDRATKDERAVEITADEYFANVPAEAVQADAPKAVNGSQRPATEAPASAEPTPEEQDITAKQAAWGSLEDWIKHYSQFITVQDMIAMTTLINHQLCATAFRAMEAHRTGKPS